MKLFIITFSFFFLLGTVAIAQVAPKKVSTTDPSFQNTSPKITGNKLDLESLSKNDPNVITTTQVAKTSKRNSTHKNASGNTLTKPMKGKANSVTSDEVYQAQLNNRISK